MADYTLFSSIFPYLISATLILKLHISVLATLLHLIFYLMSVYQTKVIFKKIMRGQNNSLFS